MADFKTLIAPPTLEQLTKSALKVSDKIGFPLQAWLDKKGSTAESLTGVFLACGESAAAWCSSVVSLVSPSESVDPATTAEELFGMLPLGATFAAGQLELTTAAAPVSWAKGETLATASGGRSYIATAAGGMAAMTTGKVWVQATIAGPHGNALPSDALTYAPATAGVTARFPSPVWGQDQESDDSLRRRMLLARSSIGLGRPESYEAAARRAKDSAGVWVGVTRVSVVASNGIARVYCARDDGGLSPAQLADVRAELELVRIETDGVEALSATPRVIAPTVTLWSRGALSDDELAAIQAATFSAFAAVPIGGFRKATGSILPGEFIAAAIIGAVPKVVDVDGFVDTPLASVEAASWGGTFVVRGVKQ